MGGSGSFASRSTLKCRPCHLYYSKGSLFGIGIGYKSHRVAISASDCEILAEFDISHSRIGFNHFFHRVKRHRKRAEVPVAVATEGYNGYARPLDRLIRESGYSVYIDLAAHALIFQ